MSQTIIPNHSREKLFFFRSVSLSFLVRWIKTVCLRHKFYTPTLNLHVQCLCFMGFVWSNFHHFTKFIKIRRAQQIEPIYFFLLLFSSVIISCTHHFLSLLKTCCFDFSSSYISNIRRTLIHPNTQFSMFHNFGSANIDCMASNSTNCILNLLHS